MEGEGFWLAVDLLLILGFALFLRTGEILQLTPEDVTMSRQKAVVFVKSSKGAKRMFLPLERLEIDEPSALQAIRELVKSSFLAGVQEILYGDLAFYSSAPQASTRFLQATFFKTWGRY